MLDKVDGDDIQHPIHLYPLEKGSFTAWKHNDILPCPTLSYPSYTVFYCHPTTSYLVLHWILLPSYHILPSRTHPIPNYILSYLVLHWTLLPSYPVLPHPTLYSTAILPHPTSSYTGFFCHPTISYPVVHILSQILSQITFYPTSSYTGLFCHPTLSYLILPSLNPTNYPTLSYLILPSPTHLTLFPTAILPQVVVGRGRMDEK